MRSISLAILAAALSASAAAQPQAHATAVAGPQMTLGISPLRVEVKATPGAETSQAVRITNNGETATQIRVTASDWTLTPRGDQLFVKPGGTSWACASWLRVNPSEFSLPAGGAELVRYTLKTPAGALEGGYHCAILFETLPPPKERLSAGMGVVNLLRLVTTVYATVGDPSIVAKIDRLELSPRRGGPGPAHEVVTDFSNPGTVQYRVSGALEILDAQGRPVRKFEYKSFPVLPGISRSAAFPLDEPLPPGDYLLRAIVDVGGKERLAAETRVRVSAS